MGLPLELAQIVFTCLEMREKGVGHSQNHPCQAVQPDQLVELPTQGLSGDCSGMARTTMS
jgi:hypothetical protein